MGVSSEIRFIGDKPDPSKPVGECNLFDFQPDVTIARIFAYALEGCKGLKEYEETLKALALTNKRFSKMCSDVNLAVIRSQSEVALPSLRQINILRQFEEIRLQMEGEGYKNKALIKLYQMYPSEENLQKVKSLISHITDSCSKDKARFMLLKVYLKKDRIKENLPKAMSLIDDISDAHIKNMARFKLFKVYLEFYKEERRKENLPKINSLIDYINYIANYCFKNKDIFDLQVYLKFIKKYRSEEDLIDEMNEYFEFALFKVYLEFYKEDRSEETLAKVKRLINDMYDLKDGARFKLLKVYLEFYKEDRSEENLQKIVSLINDIRDSYPKDKAKLELLKVHLEFFKKDRSEEALQKVESLIADSDFKSEARFKLLKVYLEFYKEDRSEANLQKAISSINDITDRLLKHDARLELFKIYLEFYKEERRKENLPKINRLIDYINYIANCRFKNKDIFDLQVYLKFIKKYRSEEDLIDEINESFEFELLKVYLEFYKEDRNEETLAKVKRFINNMYYLKDEARFKLLKVYLKFYREDRKKETLQKIKSLIADIGSRDDKDEARFELLKVYLKFFKEGSKDETLQNEYDSITKLAEDESSSRKEIKLD